MKNIIFIGFILAWLSSCQPAKKNEQDTPIIENNKKDKSEVIFKDDGAEPLVIDIEDYTIKNETFRTAIWTGRNLQLTVMSIPVGGEIGLEMHENIEQFLRIEEGEAEVLMGDSEDTLTYAHQASGDDSIFVPSGKWHNIINKGDKPLKLYSIYAKPEHPHGTIHKDKSESDAAHNDHE